ncbi:MAG: tRNA (adenosine(37)-N6)-dimethylallyltransferase MiaA [Planctomycetaceae bacterium]|nr:tRNA (adenosine(37)-N6)-dimethylallyltransferase MiaA [Planctomycetaceae bacterium]
MRLDEGHLRQCWFLAGPTAAGKTALSVTLAARLNAEIVSMDSMAIYRNMNIGTAKPSAAEQQNIPHHLIDIVDAHEEFSVAQYVAAAENAVAGILRRGRVPLFVGGTGLYLRSLLRGVFQGPEADWNLRRELQAQAESQGREWLHQQLQQLDPVTARRLHINDMRRIIRAIEVCRLTGKPMSDQHAEHAVPPDRRPRHVYWIEPPRDQLQQRIDQRVDAMMQAGLLQETRRLLEQQPPPGRTARQALGYRELIDHLENGTPLDQAVDRIKLGTRQFAKRQHTWFRNLEECTAIAVDCSTDPEAIVERILQQ